MHIPLVMMCGGARTATPNDRNQRHLSWEYGTLAVTKYVHQCDWPCIKNPFATSARSKHGVMDRLNSEPLLVPCQTAGVERCSLLLMCLRNNILNLRLSECQPVWPTGDVLNGILIIEIFLVLYVFR